ncbi:hypothetical protein CGLO_14449 [Colletotrichum gloeosporioides Cg-14]|uniref:Uncharacterized protein n=1 Tax=Colletotrichum gloeosporioides (strain Cg-14) TaxID=1237896 RepID=T0K3Z7_COLGC|nr:hypothetical protein CGLO_14449 [Colletotrichum gloeosporioides Cg-14]
MAMECSAERLAKNLHHS